jgi:two-component system cell cycle response regulator DivK
MWRVWLTFWGFSVEEASNGAEAVVKAAARRPDLVMMDLWMPVLDGLAATVQLRTDPATAEVPIFAMSASPATPTPERAKEAGCDLFLPKPLDPDVLMEHLRKAFRALPVKRVEN